MKSRIFLSYNLLGKLINQVMQYFLTNCLFFLTKFWMLQERKPLFCGIFATFFQCYFMSETQVLMNVSDFLGFFSRNYFLEGGFTFQWEGIWFSVEWSLNFKRRGAPLGSLALMGGEIYLIYLYN